MLRTRLKHAFIALCLVLSGSLITVPVASAVTNQFKNDACDGLSQVNGGTGCTPRAGNSLDNLIHAIIQIFSVAVGVAAVIMLMVAGLKFVASNGDSSSVASARSAAMYSLIGLVIVALAQILVHFVLKNTGKSIR